eukprot:GHRR01000862.1.p1 GENE.GHRR01000862.1~~GHRR01000862.1.p1  ORF type:complete len:642 (+),score=246.10 GHRR01000862.1:97-2022(+)
MLPSSPTQVIALPSRRSQLPAVQRVSGASCRSVCVVSAPRSRAFRPMARRQPIVICAHGLAHPGEEASKGGEIQGQLGVFMSVPNVTMAKGGGRDMGSSGSLGMVLERSKLEFVMPSPPQQAPKLDDGGSGGDSGKNIHNGGGGGDGDDGDDDDYFGEDGDGDGDGQGGGRGDGFFRTAIPELYDRLTISAVLQEWYKTIADLPLFIRRAVEMGLFSSAQLVRFLSMDVRPNVTRAVSRALPAEWARGFVGRLMADPAFIHKLVFEQVLAFSSSMVYEWKVRGDSFKKELDLALINSIGLAASVGATVWITAPSRAYGAVHKFPWQQMLANLPHCVFDASGPLRQYTRTARLGGFFASMAQLSAVGAITGGLTSLASQAAVKIHQQRDAEYSPLIPVADAGRSSAGLGAFFAVNANIRYQLLGGMDRYLFGHSNYLWTYLGFSMVARSLFAGVGELSRPWWQGLSTDSAASHVARSKKVRRVRKKVNKSGTVSSQTPSAAAHQAQLAQQAAAVAAGLAVAAATDGSSLPQLEGLTNYQATASISGSDGSSPADAALQSYQPITADTEGLASRSQTAAKQLGEMSLEASLQQQLQSRPAVMGSATSLQDVIEQQQPQQSLTDAAMGAASAALQGAAVQVVHA